MKNGTKQSGFTLIEFLIVLALIGVAIAFLGPRLLAGSDASAEKQIAEDLTSLYGGAVKWKGAASGFSGVSCNTVVAGQYAAVGFTTCTGSNPEGGNYTLAASGTSVTATATGLESDMCTRLTRLFTSSGKTASCAGGTVSVTF